MDLTRMIPLLAGFTLLASRTSAHAFLKTVPVPTALLQGWLLIASLVTRQDTAHVRTAMLKLSLFWRPVRHRRAQPLLVRPRVLRVADAAKRTPILRPVGGALHAVMAAALFGSSRRAWTVH